MEPKYSAAKMTLADYQTARNRAVYKEAGYSLLTDAEIQMAADIVEARFSRNETNFGLNDLQRAQNRPGALFLTTNRRTIEYAKRAGQAVLQFQHYKARQSEAAIEKGRNYATDAVGGFVQPLLNAPVNVLNGISEPFRAGERLVFGTSRIPAIPRMQAAERSEYWNKDGRRVINTGAEITTTILFGGAAGGKAIGTQAGRIFLATESSYNIGAGIVGRDVTQPDEQGNARQMNYLERGLRVTGGIFGARQTIRTEIATPHSITNRAVDKLDDIFKNPPTFKPHGEFVTPEGVKVKVPLTEEVPENTFQSKAISGKSPVGRRNLDSHEGVSGVREGKEVGHAILKHVGKSERWLQNRVKNEGIREASSFYNKSVGNRTIGKFVKENKEAIEAWVKTGRDDKFRAVVDMKEGIGLLVGTSKKGTPLAATEATKAKIVLVRDNSEFGWHLFTVMLKK